jgi:hypothetical protein
MLIVETAVAVTLLCASTKRQRIEDFAYSMNSSAKQKVFQIASGRTLESKMTGDIEEMAGVVAVTVKRTGDTFDVSVIMENMDFDPFRAVVEKELALDGTYPDLTFNFEILPKAALEEASALHYNAA